MRVGSYDGKIVPFQYYSKYKGDLEVTVIFRDSDSNLILSGHNAVQTLSNINCPKHYAVFVYDSSVIVSKRIAEDSYVIWNVTDDDINGLYESQIRTNSNYAKKLYSYSEIALYMDKADIVICTGADFGPDKHITYTYDEMVKMMADNPDLVFGNADWDDSIRVITIQAMGNNILGLLKTDTGKIRSWNISDNSKAIYSDQYYIVQ